MKHLFELSVSHLRLILRMREVVILLVLLVLTAPLGGLVYRTVNYDRPGEQSYPSTDEMISQNLAHAEELQKRIDSGEGDISTLQYDLVNDYSEAYYYRLLQDKGLADNEYHYLNKVAETLAQMQAKQKVAQLYAQSDLVKQVESGNFISQEQTYQTIFDDEDYSAYMKEVERQIRSSEELDATQRGIELTVRRYRLAADLHGRNTGAELDELLNMIRRNAYAGELGYDQAADAKIPLSSEAYAQIARDASIAQYRLSNGLVNLSEKETVGDASAPTVWKIMRLFILGIMIFLGGIWISNELHTGRLYVALLQPVKRSALMFSRLSVYTVLGILITIAAYFWNVLWTFVLYGTVGQAAYFTLCASGVRMIPGIWFGLICALLEFVWIWLAMLFAFTLSVTWRSTVAACVLPLGAYFVFLFSDGRQTAGLPAAILKYWPGYHFDLASVFFSGGQEGACSVLFTVGYLLTIGVVLLVTSCDSFTRRDF